MSDGSSSRTTEASRASPTHELMLRFQRDLQVADRWAMSGHHYAKTLSAWAERLDANTDEALAILAAADAGDARVLLGQWRLIPLSTA